MKKLYTILLLLFGCNMLFAQQQAPKKSNKIIVKNDKSASDNFLAVKLILAEKGIDIASQDKDIYQLKTGITPITKYGASAYYIIFCKDNSIQLSGMFNTGVESNMLVKDTDPFKQIVNRGLSFSITREAWNEMNNLAVSFGGEIQYIGEEKKVKSDRYKDDVY